MEEVMQEVEITPEQLEAEARELFLKERALRQKAFELRRQRELEAFRELVPTKRGPEVEILLFDWPRIGLAWTIGKDTDDRRTPLGSLRVPLPVGQSPLEAVYAVMEERGEAERFIEIVNAHIHWIVRRSEKLFVVCSDCKEDGIEGGCATPTCDFYQPDSLRRIRRA